MLVLSRKVGETVCIGENIYVKVISVDGGRVKLSFDCPLEIPIHREEVRQRILDGEKSARQCAAA